MPFHTGVPGGGSVTYRAGLLRGAFQVVQLGDDSLGGSCVIKGHGQSSCNLLCERRWDVSRAKRLGEFELKLRLGVPHVVELAISE